MYESNLLLGVALHYCFPWSGHTRGGPGGGLAGRESLDAGLPGPLPVVFPPPPCPPVAPRQADALALRREVERLQAHPSIVEIDRLRFRARAPRRRLRSVAVAEDPLAVVFPLFFPIDPSQECEPRPTFDLGLDLEKALGPAAFFFWVFSSAERALRSAERALRSAERAQCRAGT